MIPHSTGFQCDECGRTWPGKRQMSDIEGTEICPECYDPSEHDPSEDSDDGDDDDGGDDDDDDTNHPLAGDPRYTLTSPY